MVNAQQKEYQEALAAALDYYLMHGVDEALGDESIDRTAAAPPVEVNIQARAKAEQASVPSAEKPLFLGKSDARAEAARLAAQAETLETLKTVIVEFDGIGLKKTATNLVFSAGNSKASVMIVGEAPGADEDRLGAPFVGVSGQLLDRMLACIGLDRKAEERAKSVYISNIVNWRPPGNRTPAPAEIEVSLPFIERHIQLAAPALLVLCGGVAAQALLGSGESVSRLRKKWHIYKTISPELESGGVSVPALVTYHPSYLLRTPAQKKLAWADMLALDEKLAELGLRRT